MANATSAVSPLRRRMIDDMTLCNLSPATQCSYLHALAKFSRYFDRSPDQLGLEDVRAFQVYLVEQGILWPGLNQTVCALRFSYGVTLNGAEILERIAYARTPQKLPTILSADEVVRLLKAVQSLKARAALTTAYAAGLRASEPVSLKVSVHTLRHHFATHLLESDVDVRVIHLLLGHSILSTNARYTQVATTTIAKTQSPFDRLSLEVVPPG